MSIVSDYAAYRVNDKMNEMNETCRAVFWLFFSLNFNFVRSKYEK